MFLSRKRQPGINLNFQGFIFLPGKKKPDTVALPFRHNDYLHSRSIGKQPAYLDHIAGRLKGSSFAGTGCMFQESMASACDTVQDKSDQQGTHHRKIVQQDLLPPRHWCSSIQHSMNHLVPTDPNVNRTLLEDIWCNRLQTATHLCHQMYPTTVHKFSLNRRSQTYTPWLLW